MVSFIISYMKVDESREANLNCVLTVLASLPVEKQIIVVEQGEKQTVFSDLLDVIFVEKEGLFHKSFLYNTAVPYAKFDTLFFHDADLFMSVGLYLENITQALVCDVVNPYNKLIYLSPQETVRLRNNPFKARRFRGVRTLHPRIISGGCFCIKKRLYQQIGGFDERFIGYGYEDSEFDLRLKEYDPSWYLNVSGFALHLHHLPQDKTVRNKLLYIKEKEKYPPREFA